MKKRFWITFLIIVILSASVSACLRSASNAPVATATESNNLPFPTPLPSSAISNALAGTETAMALQNPTSAVANTNTPQPVPTQEATTPPQPQSTNTTAPVQVQATATQQPAPTMVVVPSATPGRPATYTLHLGEFPFCIARRFNLDVSALLALNGLTINSHPSAGTVLQIPQTGTWDAGSRALKTHPTTYTVSAGDTIYNVACRFGDVDPSAIVYANGLQSPYTLTAGQALNIP